MYNDRQTQFEDLHLDQYPKEVQESFLDFMEKIPFLQNMTSPVRNRAKDLERDEEGKIKVDITNPHILEDMDYFRPSAIHFQQFGCYTKLRPNPNPNSEYGKWAGREIRRCWYGMVRPSDGEWIPGDYYHYLNYCPIQLIEKLPNGQSIRTVDFPRPWDGQYLVQHYLYNARKNSHHAAELASRGKGKSFMGAGLLSKRFKLGENEYTKVKVLSAVTASDKKYLWGPNQILNMFKYYIDFQSQHTQFPRQLLTDSAQLLMWESGYKDKETGVRKGTQNTVVGVTTGVNQDKLNGSRGVLYLIEEAGIFSDLGSLYQMIRPSVEDGKSVYGLIFMYGTAGDEESNFTDLQEIMYNPLGYNMEANPNVWDKEGQGKKWFTFFYPAYMNRSGCMDKDGNSDVTKALLEICDDRYTVKYNSTDVNAITKRVSQYPVTPQEAILRSTASIFPITELTEQRNAIDNNPRFFDDTAIGDLVIKGTEVEFRITDDTPIRSFPTKDNKVLGAIEIHCMPIKGSDGKVPQGRYIAGADPYDDDTSDTMSLGSIFIFDTWTDLPVAEYTGRPQLSEIYYETCRKLCLFYNATLMYENNKKGLYAYFSKTHALHLLADTPEYIKDKDDSSSITNNKSKGICIPGGGSLKKYGYRLIRDWLLSQYTEVTTNEEGETVEIPKSNLYRLRCRALIEELIHWNPDCNVDRIMAFMQVMFYREEKMIMYGGDLKASGRQTGSSLAEDDFFKRNFKRHTDIG